MRVKTYEGGAIASLEFVPITFTPLSIHPSSSYLKNGFLNFSRTHPSHPPIHSHPPPFTPSHKSHPPSSHTSHPSSLNKPPALPMICLTDDYITDVDVIALHSVKYKARGEIWIFICFNFKEILFLENQSLHSKNSILHNLTRRFLIEYFNDNFTL